MPSLKNRQYELFATALVFPSENGKRRFAWQAYQEAFPNSSYHAAKVSAHRLLQREDVAARVKELNAERVNAVKLVGYAVKVNRQEVYNEGIARILSIIEERAADPSMQDIPGGTSGLLVRDFRTVPVKDDAEADEEGAKAKSWERVDLVKFDSALVKELRELMRQAADDERDFKTHADVTTGGHAITGMLFGELSIDDIDRRIAEAEGRKAPPDLPEGS